MVGLIGIYVKWKNIGAIFEYSRQIPILIPIFLLTIMYVAKPYYIIGIYSHVATL